MANEEMVLETQHGEQLYNVSTMADGARNTGYKSTYNAIAEIVDNSIENKEKNVFIIGSQDLVLNQQGIKKFAFLDDGDGMSEDVLAKCLQIGFTTRQHRTGMGRFGVGLPQASYHVSPRVEVYSWRDGIENCKCVYVDWDLVTDRKQDTIIGPYVTDIPDEYKQFIHFSTDEKEYDFSQHGTLVVWPKCDRVDHKRWNTCRRNISEDLGRKYRWMLNDNTVSIATVEVNDLETFELLLPNDPLFLMKKSQFCVRENCNDSNPSCQRYNEEDGYTESIFEPYTDEDNLTGVVDHPVYYFDKKGERQESTVKVRFSIVKEKYYSKDYIASDPGSLAYGKSVRKNTGISIVRQNREIDFGNFGFFDATNNPYHRWWGCEISFTPELDEAFGIANNKQQVDLKEIDDEALADYDGNEPMWIQLKSVIKNTIDDMVKLNKERRKGTRSNPGKTATTATSETVKAAEEENPDIVVPTTVVIPEITEEIKVQVEKELQDEGYEEVTEEQIQQYLDSNTRIKYVNHGSRGAFIDYEDRLGVLKIIVNKDHQFYEQFVQDAYQNEDMQITFELFLVSLIKTVYQLHATHPVPMDKLIDDINNRLKVYLKQGR